MFQNLSDLEDVLKAKNVQKKLVLAVSQDPHSLEAVSRAVVSGFIDPILVGSKKQTLNLINQYGYALHNADFIDVENPKECIEQAIKLVSSGEADILMKGKVSTHDLLAGILNRDWGLRSGAMLSHFSLFEVPAYHKLLSVTDVAMNITPSLKEKADIVNNAVNFLHKIGVELPKVAALAAVEVINESMQATLDAAALAKMNQRGQIKNCILDGPLALDNAINLESAAYKGISSEVAGDADLLLVPYIEVGNVLYKSLVFFAKARVAGIILGAKAPVVLASRSDSSDSKFNSIMLAAFG